MAVILITGAKGQLGSELKNVSKNFYGYDFIFTDVDDLDITDPVMTAGFIKKNEPGWIINCAAYNTVDRAETEADKVMLVNSTAVRNIAEAIRGSECRFIHISSDYVFDGTSCAPYDEDASPDPQTAYGRSSLQGRRQLSAITDQWL